MEAIPFLQGERGRPRNRPDCVIGDRGYDAEAIRQSLRFRGIRPMLAKRNTEHGSGLGRSRWVIERTFAWLSQFRRLRVRYQNGLTSTRHSCRSDVLSSPGTSSEQLG